MEIFIIVQFLIADSGHVITVVKAKDENEARTKYKAKYPWRWDLGITITEMTEDVQTAFEYDNPDYKG